MRRLCHHALVAAAAATLACKEATGPERELSGEKIFRQHCARCHGLDGKGAPDQPTATPDLTDPARMGALSDEQVKGVIRAGRPPNMPAFAGEFTEASVQVLLAYLREIAGPTGESPGGAAKTSP